MASLLHPTLPVALSPLLLFQTRIHSASVPVTHWPGAPQLSLCSFGVSPPPAAAHCEAFSESAPPAPVGPTQPSGLSAQGSGVREEPSPLGNFPKLPALWDIVGARKVASKESMWKELPRDAGPSRQLSGSFLFASRTPRPAWPGKTVSGPNGTLSAQGRGGNNFLARWPGVPSLPHTRL